MSTKSQTEEWDTVDTGPEVFETSDVESVDVLEPPEESSSDVDRSVLDPNAKDRAEFNVISTGEEADFLGSLTSGHLGYSLRRVHETAAQKFARIQAELAELKDENIHENEVDKLTKSLEELLEGRESANSIHAQRLRAGFDRLNQRLSDQNVSTDRGQIDEKQAPKDLILSDRKGPGTEVLELEKKLYELENIVGVADLESSKSVRNHVDDLRRKVEVIYDPEFDLAHVKGEIKRLSKEMDELNAKRRMAQIANSNVSVKPSTPFEVKVDSIYEILPEMETAMAAVPLLIARLKSLHQVHAEIGHSVSAVSNIDKTIESLHLEMKNWSENVDQVNAAIDAHTVKFEESRRNVETRIEGFERRLAEIGHKA